MKKVKTKKEEVKVMTNEEEFDFKINTFSKEEVFKYMFKVEILNDEKDYTIKLIESGVSKKTLLNIKENIYRKQKVNKDRFYNENYCNFTNLSKKVYCFEIKFKNVTYMLYIDERSKGTIKLDPNNVLINCNDYYTPGKVDEINPIKNIVIVDSELSAYIRGDAVIYATSYNLLENRYVIDDSVELKLPSKETLMTINNVIFDHCTFTCTARYYSKTNIITDSTINCSHIEFVGGIRMHDSYIINSGLSSRSMTKDITYWNRISVIRSYLKANKLYNIIFIDSKFSLDNLTDIELGTNDNDKPIKIENINFNNPIDEDEIDIKTGYILLPDPQNSFINKLYLFNKEIIFLSIYNKDLKRIDLLFSNTSKPIHIKSDITDTLIESFLNKELGDYVNDEDIKYFKYNTEVTLVSEIINNRKLELSIDRLKNLINYN